MKYLIVDLSNMFFRARHTAHRAASLEDRVGFAIHTSFASINKCWREQGASHVVIALEGRSWRKDFYTPYKKNRADLRAAQTASEQEEDKMFWQAYDELKQFLIDYSNCTILHSPILEADDLIAGFIQQNTNDEHTVISTDSDFHQLLSHNVKQYNGITDELFTINGIFNGKNKPVVDKKTKQPKTLPDPNWILFEKIMRGDSTDNVFSAYPGVRIKSSKKSVGLLEAFEDRDKKGFAWNAIMLSKWVDHNNEEHLVLDDYNRNKTLIDLTAQPAHIKEEITKTIIENSKPKNKGQVGLYFLKFCGKHDLVKLSENADRIIEWLRAEFSDESLVS